MPLRWPVIVKDPQYTRGECRQKRRWWNVLWRHWWRTTEVYPEYLDHVLCRTCECWWVKGEDKNA